MTDVNSTGDCFSKLCGEVCPLPHPTGRSPGDPGLALVPSSSLVTSGSISHASGAPLALHLNVCQPAAAPHPGGWRERQVVSCLHWKTSTSRFCPWLQSTWGYVRNFMSYPPATMRHMSQFKM
ncbi:hypothetical protein BaRGS_00030994 [Batillaria attramentaria]|uniref:Uncharacterized protein n=1 Tax=Batillaria attramentaria TaxID=370345 RepID=A0ABD0JSR3_9CAEN